jgi:hypothetical protein
MKGTRTYIEIREKPFKTGNLVFRKDVTMMTPDEVMVFWQEVHRRYPPSAYHGRTMKRVGLLEYGNL